MLSYRYVYLLGDELNRLEDWFCDSATGPPRLTERSGILLRTCAGGHERRTLVTPWLAGLLGEFHALNQFRTTARRLFFFSCGSAASAWTD